MVSVTKKFEFPAGHHLPNHEGSCKRFHGHNYLLEVTISGEIKEEGPEKGMIMDFGKLKQVVLEYISQFDHQDLNDFWENPTAENMVGTMAFALKSPFARLGVELINMKLWETPTSYAEWRKG